MVATSASRQTRSFITSRAPRRGVGSRGPPVRPLQSRRRMVIQRVLPVLATLLVACADEPLDLGACDPPELYRITRIGLPQSNTEAIAAGFDLNGDRQVDN